MILDFCSHVRIIFVLRPNLAEPKTGWEEVKLTA